MVFCATCHDPGLHKASGVENYALRLPVPILCRKCHAEDRRMSRPEHGIAIRRAHLVEHEDGTDARGLDRLTRACLGCHDGSAAAEHKAPAVLDGSHPIGSVYDESSREGRLSHLRPKADLPPEVQIPGDKVSCVSCHSPFSKKEHFVTVTVELSELCRSCHAM
ncbi:MAG: hypothetical protein Fur0037_23480 [Planctomycetota bacterium]